jgi:hypothetical protein
MDNYLWSLVDDELTIEMQEPEFYTVDLLPGILREIISAISLPVAEKIRHIRVGVIGG